MSIYQEITELFVKQSSQNEQWFNEQFEAAHVVRRAVEAALELEGKLFQSDFKHPANTPYVQFDEPDKMHKHECVDDLGFYHFGVKVALERGPTSYPKTFFLISMVIKNNNEGLRYTFENDQEHWFENVEDLVQIYVKKMKEHLTRSNYDIVQ